MLIRMSGWAASRETTHLLPGSSKRPDIRAHIAGRCVLFDVRACAMTSGMGPQVALGGRGGRSRVVVGRGLGSAA